MLFCAHPVHTATATSPGPIPAPVSTHAWWHDPAWVGAWATIGLFVFAIVTAFYARRAYLKQSAEVALLQEQAARDIEQRRKAQAAKVFIARGGIPPADPDLIRICNTSDQPVYDLMASGAADDAHSLGLLCLLPGEDYRVVGGGYERLFFRDASGVRWRTTERGGLVEDS